MEDRRFAFQSWNEATGRAVGDPISRSLPLAVADVLLGGGDYAQARDYYRLFLQRSPDDPAAAGAHQRLAQAYYHLGDDQAAVLAYKEYIRAAAGGPKISAPTGDFAEIRPSPGWELFRMRARMQADRYERVDCPSISSRTASPWLAMLVRPPILTIRTQAPAFKLSAWNLVIYDEKGVCLYRRTEKPPLPATLTWDGLCSDGRRIAVGERFAYSVLLTDTSGKLLNTSAKPGMLSAFADLQARELRISLLSSALFTADSGSRLTPVGTSFLRESCDWILRYLDQTLRIEVAGDTKAGRARGETIRQYILGKLNLPPDSIRVDVLTSPGSKQERVDLICPRFPGENFGRADEQGE